jgi:putative restriction endonuclease
MDYLDQLEMDFNSNSAADRLPKEYRIIEIETRCAIFKTRIPKIYNDTCAISRQRIISINHTQIIDACQILPWRITKDDTMQNGIALTSTLHRAFDRGIVKINPGYPLSISKEIAENEDAPFSLRQFEGNKTLLLK